MYKTSQLKPKVQYVCTKGALTVFVGDSVMINSQECLVNKTTGGWLTKDEYEKSDIEFMLDIAYYRTRLFELKAEMARVECILLEENGGGTYYSACPVCGHPAYKDQEQVWNCSKCGWNSPNLGGVRVQ